jgi:predicted metal-dependent phosphoesterase TrpH
VRETQRVVGEYVLTENGLLAGLSGQKHHDIIAIADHNLVSALPEAIPASFDYRITVIPAIEIDCNYQGTDLHVLGYNIDWHSKDFAILEADIARKIMDSFAQMVENLRKLGIELDPSEVLEKAVGTLPTVELIAEVLLGNEKYAGIHKLDPYRSGGNRSDMPYLNFYLDFFAQGKPAYVKLDLMDYADALDLVNNNKGVAVIAHPGLNFEGREVVVKDLLKMGAKGLEAFNNYHNEEQIQFFAEVAIKNSALMTCGSDFHGKTKPLIRIGEFKKIGRYEAYVAESVEELLCR